MIPGVYGSPHPDDVQDQELGGVQSIPEATRVVIDPLTVRASQRDVPRGAQGVVRPTLEADDRVCRELAQSATTGTG